MISGFFIFNRKGDVLISKLFRDQLRHNIAEVFRIQVITSREVRSPVLTLGSTTFLHIKADSLWMVAVARSNQDAAIIFEFLEKFKTMLEAQLVGESVMSENSSSVSKELTEDDVVNNFTHIYRLLDQCIEFGYPQNMDVVGDRSGARAGGSLISKVTTNTANMLRSPDLGRRGNMTREGDVAWRRVGIKYRKNEVLVSVNEEVNVLMTASGEVLKSYVDGSVQMKTKLTGMPVCWFGLNDSVVMDSADSVEQMLDYDVKDADAIPTAASGAVVLEDCKFHQCVELGKFDSSRLIHFVPPDGEFELMRYRVSEDITLPFLVVPKFEDTHRSPLRFSVSVRSLFAPKLVANNVVIRIPVPPGSIKAELEATSGKARFSTEECVVFWKFSKYSGNHEALLQGSIEIVAGSVTTTASGNSDVLLSPTLKSPKPTFPGWTKPPIVVKFSLDSFIASGMIVRYLKVSESSNYSTVKYVKYCTKAGTYEIRY